MGYRSSVMWDDFPNESSSNKEVVFTLNDQLHPIIVGSLNIYTSPELLYVELYIFKQMLVFVCIL